MQSGFWQWSVAIARHGAWGGAKRTVAALLLSGTLSIGSGCDDQSIVIPPTDEQRLVRDDTSLREVSDETAEFLEDRRAEVELLVQGGLTPGAPISLVSRVTGRRATTALRLRIRASLSTTGRLVVGDEAIVERPIGPGDVIEQRKLVTFPEPGYYHVMATVNSAVDSDARDDRRRGMLASEVVTSNRWILIDDEGGRVDDQYDQSIVRDTTRYLTNGSIGAFRSRKFNAPLSTAAETMAAARAPMASSSSSVSQTFSGRITFVRSDGFGNSAVEGVSGARVSGYCSTVHGVSLGGFDLIADQQGAFAVSCPSDAWSINVTAALSSSSAVVNNHNNTFAGATGWISLLDFGLQVPLAVNNNDAAQVFLNHQRYNSVAASLFGRSRGALTYRVSNSTDTGTNYAAGSDFVRIAPNAAWGRNGIFVVAHEYGHAFHYAAVDPWVLTSYYCSPNGQHLADQPYTTGCAYVEGFADFFAARVVNSVDGSLANADFLSQMFLETNQNRTIGNGLIIESTFASLLLDMVDSPNDDDGISGDDDALSISAYDLTQIMRMCRMSNPNAALLTHSDQFVYCAAGSKNERSFAPTSTLSFWGVYGGLSYDAGTSLPLQSVFRALWRYNLYNL